MGGIGCGAGCGGDGDGTGAGPGLGAGWGLGRSARRRLVGVVAANELVNMDVLLLCRELLEALTPVGTALTRRGLARVIRPLAT